MKYSMGESMALKMIHLLKGQSVRTAFRFTFGALTPLLVMKWLGREELGLELMLGTILVSAADIREPFRDKVRTLLATSLMSASLTFLISMAARDFWVLMLVMFVVIFLLAYIAPFGLRYTMVAFMGFLAVIIALSTYQQYQDLTALFYHSLKLLAGSLWYTSLALVVFFFTARQQLVQMVVEGMRQTAAYLRQRVSMYDPQNPLDDGMLLLSDRQSELTEIHTQLREFLLENPSQLIRSQSFQRKMLLVFAEIIDMLEAALATPLEYRQWHGWLQQYPQLKLIPQISQLQIKELEHLAGRLSHENANSQSYLPELEEKMEKLRVFLQEFKPEFFGDQEKERVYREAVRIQTYQGLQYNKLYSLANIIRDEPEKAEVTVDDGAHLRFANARLVTWNSIRSNFTFHSSFFRYALRTSVTAILGYMLGTLLALENTYWVLLTILVVMKPGYAVTRQRFIHRIIGTIAGAAIAFALYLPQPSHNTSLAIFGLSYFLAYTFLSYKYVVTTIFFTIYVVFLYSFLNKEIPSMVIYRIADTILGGVLCFAALHYLWPSWEHKNLPYHLRKSMEANQELFFQVMKQVYNKKVELTEYRLARKNAYISMANVVSSFQRFKTEPKKKQKAAAQYSDSLLLNYTILSIISTIGVYIRRYPELLEELGPLKEKFFRIHDEMETVLDLVYHEPGAHLPAEGSRRSESEWKKNRQGWMNFDGSDQKIISEEELDFIREQLERLEDLVLRLQEQTKKVSTVSSPEEAAGIPEKRSENLPLNNP